MEALFDPSVLKLIADFGISAFMLVVFMIFFWLLMGRHADERREWRQDMERMTSKSIDAIDRLADALNLQRPRGRL